MRTVVLLFVGWISVSDVFGMAIMERLEKFAENVRGEDLCDGCDEELCNQEPACGYVQVKNGGGYVAKACVNGQNNVTNADFCCTSGSFDLGQTAQIKLPCSATKLTLTAEEDVFIDSWSVVATVNYNNNTVHACYDMYGTTTNSKWKTVGCP